jgi:hypothetical protein
MATNSSEITHEIDIHNPSNPRLKELVAEITDKIKAIESFAAIKKRKIFTEYAPFLAEYMPAHMVCGKLVELFDKDSRIIHDCLGDEYKDLSKIRRETSGNGEELDRLLNEESTSHLDATKKANRSKTFLQHFYEISDIELDWNILQEGLRNLSETPDKLVIKQMRGVAVEVKQAE